MQKHIRFLVLLMIATLVITPIGIFAQETTEDAVVLEEVVMPRLLDYGENLPDHYGTVGIDDFVKLIIKNEDLVILDVREVAEVEETGVIKGAIHIPMRELGENLALLPDLDATIVVVCKGGFRATIAMTALHVLGYENAQVLVGGMSAWFGEDLPVVEEPAMVEAMDIPEDIDPLLVEYVADHMTNLPEGWGGVKPVNLFEEMFDAMPDLLLDVRSDGEWADPGYIEGATHVWIDEFTMNLDALPEDLDANIVVYCASGYRGNVVATMLRMIGYTEVRNLSGGIKGWLASDLPVVMD
jgi:rhodanese-related sulfurtransferase